MQALSSTYVHARVAANIELFRVNTAVTAEATRLAGELGAQPRVQEYNIDESSFHWNGLGGAEAPAPGGNIGGISDGTGNTYRPKSGYVIKKGKPLSAQARA
ncbi:MAG: hypothetical protein ACLFPA_10040 [Dichotomicrobium sp.]